MMRKIPIFTFTYMLSCPTISYAHDNDLCRPDEAIIANCEVINSKKIASICGQKQRDTISYRFGTRSRTELERTFTRNNPLYRWKDATTYTTYFGFRISDYAYVIGVPEERNLATAFVYIEKKDLEIASIHCAKNSFGEKDFQSNMINDRSDDEVRKNHFIFPPRRLPPP